MTKQITSADEFVAALQLPGLVVINFTASWNPPCHALAPYYAALAAKHTLSLPTASSTTTPPQPPPARPAAAFFTLDVDELPDVAEDAGIAAMPTVVCYKGGAVVGTVVGADVEALEEVIAACL
ncbi:cytosolic thioredoxin Trx1 [Zopfochytrium polystomum]|nr:cytosolic thioredoxin Trx1 [Zopfochytrium polystomum]